MMQEEVARAIPELTKTAFWDVDWDSIDFQRDSLFVMGKVINYGPWTDIRELLRFYGLERVRREVVQASYLKHTALSFLCLILDLHESDFVAYQQRQTHQPIWNH